MNKSALQMIRHASLRQLQVFEAIARHRSFTRAAEELFLAQPTVSMQVKNLSEAIGLPLFEQVGKRIYMTESGEALYSTCREVFNALAHFEMQVSKLKGLKEGQLRLAIVSTAKYFAPRALGVFCRYYPDIDISLEVTNRERLLERMADNFDDLYIMGHPPETPDVVFEPFLPNPLVVLAWGDHPLAAQKNIPIELLAAEPFIMREAGSGTRLAVENIFRKKGLVPKLRMELGSNEAIKQAVAGGLGISVLSSHTLALEGATGQLAILDVEGFPIQRHWYIGHNAGKQLSVVAQTFLDFIKTESAAIANLSATLPG